MSGYGSNPDIHHDDLSHSFIRGVAYHDPTAHVRIGPRGGRRVMSHDVPADIEALMSCAQVVVRVGIAGGDRRGVEVLTLCGRPRFQHPAYTERIATR